MNVYIYICGVNELNTPDPLHTEPKAHAEEEETPEDEQKESKLPRDIAESCHRPTEIIRRKSSMPLKTAS